MFCLPLSGLVPQLWEREGCLDTPCWGRGWAFMVTSHGGAGSWLLPKSRKKNKKLYIFRIRSKVQNKREIRG